MSPRNLILFGLLALLLPIGAFAWGSPDEAERSLSVYPKQQMPIRFDHALHLDQDMKCTDCHDADTSKNVRDRLLPGHPTCESCHDIEAASKGEETDPPSSCQTCHPGFDATAMARPRKVVAPAANLKFNHEVHVSKEIPCSRCHGEMDKVQLATRAQLPKMETCLECHKHGGDASGKCTVCHLAAPDGTVAKRMPDGSMLIPEIGNPFGVYHGPDYFKEHDQDALVARDTCAQCHTESECLACHDGAVKSLKVHPNDWITLHPVPAKHNQLECQSCHNYQSFCTTCHERIGIGPQADAQLRSTSLSVHPPGWNGPVGPNHHGIWASRDISSCASCHREEGCIKCHATTGRGGINANPHPPGFRSQACSIYRSNARVCLKCHSPAEPALSRCM